MEIDKYAEFTNTTTVYPYACSGSQEEISYLTLGLNGESAEAAEKLLEQLDLIFKLNISTGKIAERSKKLIRDHHVDMQSFHKELGDIAWYWARLCLASGKKPSEILDINVEKLTKRKQEKKLHGAGDNR